MKTCYNRFRKLLVMVLALNIMACNVYQKTPVTLENALQTRKHVKVSTKDEKEYEFLRLEKLEDQLVGVTRKRSTTVNRIETKPLVIDGNIRKFELNEEKIALIYYRNEFQTKMAQIGMPVMLIGVLTVAFFQGAGDLGGDWHSPGETQIKISLD